MNSKSLHIFSLSIFIYLLINSAANLDAESIFNGNIEITYKSDIIDLRPEYSLNRSGDGKSSADYSAEDLEIGTIFIAPDGGLREVIDIYDSNGRTVIETTEPELTEALRYLNIPEFEMTIDWDDFTELGEGVTLLTEEEAGDPGNYLSPELGGGTRLSGSASATINNTFNIDKTVYEYKTVGITLSGKKKTVKSNEIGVRVKGTLQAGIKVYGYYKLNWRCQTYATAKLTVEQNIDVNVIGTVDSQMFRSFYIGKFKKGLFTGKLYLTLSISGEATLTVRLFESTSIGTGAKKEADKYSLIWEPAYNIGFQPELEGTSTMKVGPMVVGSLDLLGKSLASATLKTGIGITLDGYVGATDLIGINQNGKYDTDWVVKASARIFAYIDSYIKILKKTIDIYDKTWTLKTWSY